MKTIWLKGTAMAAGVVGAALALAACGGESPYATPTPFSLGVNSVVLGFTPTPTAAVPKVTPAPKPTAPSGGGGTASPGDAGKAVFLKVGCTACHTIQGVPGAVGQVGPELTHVATNAEKRVAGMTAEQYIRQSEEQPSAFIVAGFPNVMPSGLVSSSADMDALIAFLLTLK